MTTFCLGTIPTGIGALTALKALDLSMNSLNGIFTVGYDVCYFIHSVYIIKDPFLVQ